MLDLRYCSCCAAALAPSPREDAPQRCASCGVTHWRNSAPAATAVILRGREVLLSKRAHEPQRGLWDLPGGFLEWGEHPREGIAREIREETGCEARVGRLVAVEMGRYEERATLNLIYEVALEGEPTPSSDSEALQWFPLDAIPRMAFAQEERVVRALAAGTPLAP